MVRESRESAPSGVRCVKKLEDVLDAKQFDCDQESGYSFFIIRAGPDANEIKSMCQSATCRVMFENMRAAAPTECVTDSGWYLYADLLNPILKGCESVPMPATGEPPYNGSASTLSTLAPATTVTPAPAPASAEVVSRTPAITTATPVADTSTKIVDSALSRGTIIAILSASVVVLTTITGLVKWWYKRRQDKKAAANGAANNQLTSSERTGKGRPQRGNENDDFYFGN